MELQNSVPECTFSTYSTDSDQKNIIDDDNLNSTRIDSDMSLAQASIIESIYEDDKASLTTHSRRVLFKAPSSSSEPLDRTIASKLLHLCCVFDSVDCASALLGGELGTVPLVNEMDETGKSALHTAAETHAARCVELLLKKRARTDLRTKDGRAQLALELSLSSPRMDVTWNPDDYSIEDLVVFLGEKDLNTVRLICEKTKETAEVACAKAVEGRIVALAAILGVAAEKINESILEFRDSDSGSKEKMTIYERVIREALSLGPANSSVKTPKGTSSPARSVIDSQRRKLLLAEIDLLQLFGVVAQSRCTDKKVKTPSPLVQAVQAGDEAVVKLLLKTSIDINEVDAEGNSALHWSVKASRAPCPREIKILLLLLKHGARVSQRNKLGLTAFHMAAGNDNSQALQILLLEDPDGINYKTEMKETPLFFAVKNSHMDCAELLLRWGANTEVLNLRRQRSVDLAKSQDMRFMLNPTNISLMNRNLSVQQKHTTWLQGNEVFLDEGGTLLGMTDEESTYERICSSARAGNCKYFSPPRGCIRGGKCFYTHGEEERQQLKQGTLKYHSPSALLLKKKIFVGGLPSQVNSDLLRKFFEEQFGSVEDAVVLVTQTGNHIQSRGFGFVTFKDEKSVLAAIQAHFVSLMDKEVEIKSVLPKWHLVNESQKLSARPDGKEKNDKYQPQEQVSHEKILEEDLPQQNSWANKLLSEQITTCSNEAQAQAPLSTAFEDRKIPTWLRIFRKWLPSFVQNLPKHPREGEYALSSLKKDFRDKFGLDLDHASIGYPKLSDFMKCYSDLCCVKVVPIGRRGIANHMVLSLPEYPRPQQHLCHMPTTPHPSSSAESIDEGDLKSSSDENVGFGLGGFGKDNSSTPLSDLSSPHMETSPTTQSRFLQFLKQDPLFHGSPWLQKEYNANKGNDANDEIGQCMEVTQVNNLSHPQRHLVLEALSRRKNNTSVYFLREVDFYRSYKASINEGKCFACSQRKVLWANIPCGHLLWCSDCKMQASLAAGSFAHKCVVCDVQVQKIDLLPCFDLSQLELVHGYKSHDEDFPPFDPNHIRSPPKKKNSFSVGF
ncbi:Splicing factor-like protein [Trema orientale]|uniref:Splicing factor-like protein n=1 Tax=Trema orientale TaxID=63057 RepID=A0A2P5D200_TREOI|nr:Splicing factor-like protein [Trema orientale]